MDRLEPSGARVSWPLSLVVFIAGTALAFLVFAPLALAGWHLEKVSLFLAATGAFAVVSLVAAFMGLRFTAALAAGHYRAVEARPWREQLW